MICTPTLKGISAFHESSFTAAHLAASCTPTYRLSSDKVVTPLLPFICHFCWDWVQEADLCSLWHPDCLLAAPGGVPWLHSCGVSCPRNAAGPSEGCWTRLHTDSNISQPLSHHFHWPPPWAREGQVEEGDTTRGLWAVGWKGRNLEAEVKR